MLLLNSERKGRITEVNWESEPMTGWPKKLSRLKEETFVVNKFYTAWRTIGAINFNESGDVTRARSNAESDFKSHRD